MHVQNGSLHVTILHKVNFNALSMHTTEKHYLARLSLQERDLAFGLIKSDVTRADVSAILTLLRNKKRQRFRLASKSPNLNVIENI